MSISTKGENVPFESPDYPLNELLRSVSSGAVQLPDFQREWKWDDDRIRSLLASISMGHPVGVVMMLETGGDGARFASKPIAGVTTLASPDRLLLDGQQRLTSLFQALLNDGPADTADPRGKRLKRWYYVDMKLVVEDGDREEAIVSVPEDKRVRDNFGKDVVADYSTMEKECTSEMFPLARLYRTGKVDEWMVAYLQVDPDNMKSRLERWTIFKSALVDNFQSYLVPVIVLTKSTPREAVCTVFEKVNTGGVPLNVFELLTATFAADQFRLNDDWKERKERLNKKPVLTSVESTDFLQIVSLLATRQRKLDYSGLGESPGISCKRKDILRLSLDEYRAWADAAENALLWSAGFLAQEHIYQARDVPYRTQLVPLAAIRAVVGPKIDNLGTIPRVQNWYWCGVLGELYGGAIETRFARDLEQVVEWLDGGPTPKTVDDGSFRAGRLLTLRTRNSAAYKGVYALLMRHGGLDWQKHQKLEMAFFFDYQVDIHHIFPHAWCLSNQIVEAQRESIVNKTAISAATNRSIGGRAPSVYMQTLQSAAKISADQLDAVVSTHAIDPATLRADDFFAFFSDRSERLLQVISQAMGKEAIRDDVTNEGNPEAFEPEQETEPESDTGTPPLTMPGSASVTELLATSELSAVDLDRQPDRASLERAFAMSMKAIYQRADRELNYRPTYFLQMLSDHGPLETARRLTMDETPSDGFTRLWQAKRLDLTVEAHVVKSEFHSLFEPDVVRAAGTRLRQYGYITDDS